MVLMHVKAFAFDLMHRFNANTRILRSSQVANDHQRSVGQAFLSQFVSQIVGRCQTKLLL